MIVNESDYLRAGRTTIIVTTIIAFLLVIFLGSALRPDNLPFEFVVSIEVLCGYLVGISLGLLLSEETRIYGFVYLGVFVLLPIVVIIASALNGSPVSLDIFFTYYGAGLLAGALIAFLSLLAGKMNLIVTFLKAGFTVLTIIATLALVLFGIISPLMTVQNPELYIQTFAFWLPVIAAVLCIVLCVTVRKLTINIRGSDVFVVGPAGSGKTVLGVGLWDTFKQKKTNKFAIGRIGKYREVYKGVLSKRENPEGVSLRNLHYKIINEHQYSAIDSTKPGDLVMFKVRKNLFGLFPITWTIIDYAGEYYDKLNYTNYLKSLDVVREKLNEDPIAQKKGKKPKIWDDKRIEKAACSGELIEVVNHSRHLDYESNAGGFQSALSIVIIYSNYMNAGKSVFLVDGDQIVDSYREWKAKKERCTYASDKDWVERIVERYHEQVEKYHKSCDSVYTISEIAEINRIVTASGNSENFDVSRSIDDDDDPWGDIATMTSQYSSPGFANGFGDDEHMSVLRNIIQSHKGGYEGKVSLGKVWENYGNMIDELRDLRIRKKIALCITKVDKICLNHPIMQEKIKEIYREQNGGAVHENVSLSLLLNNESVENKINTALYESLEATEKVHFTSIFDDYYASSTIPMYFMGTCLDGLSPDGVHVAMGDDCTLYPVGYNELLTFGTTGRFPLIEKLMKRIRKPRYDE